MKVPSLTYYLDRVPEEVAMRDLERRLDEPDRSLYVFDEGDLARAPVFVEGLERLGARGKYVVLTARADGGGPASELDAPVR
jgi:hypothetical protein